MSELLGEVDDFPWLAIRIDNHDETEIQFVIDTGFDGELVVPQSMQRRFGSISSVQSVKLASGQIFSCPVILSRIQWNGRPREVSVMVMNGNPLLGLELMRGQRLTIDIIQGGEVCLEDI